MKVLTYLQLAEIQTHFHLLIVTNRPDFNKTSKQTNGSLALPAEK